MRRCLSQLMTGAALLLLATAGAVAQDRPAVGVVGPFSGPSAILGQQLRDGATIAAGDAATLTFADDACTADGGRSAARQLVAAKVRVAIGFLCTEAIDAAMPALKDAGIPVITVGVRTDALTDRRTKTGWPVYRLAPRADAERAAVSNILTELWRTELFAIVDDGTIYSRELAESFRLAAETTGLQPVFVDTYRPQMDNQIGLVGRLRRTEATRVFVGGDRDDLAILSRDAKSLEVPLVVAGGETLRSAPGDVQLAAGTLMIGLPEWAEVAPPETVARIRAAEVQPEGYVLPAYAAMQVALAALSAADSLASGSVTGTLDAGETDTAIGKVAFDAKGDATLPFYGLFRFDGSRFIAVGDE